MVEKSQSATGYAPGYDFFDRIDTEEKAYWLGMLTADGCVYGKNQVAISLKSTDGPHLDHLAHCLGWARKAHTKRHVVKGNTYYSYGYEFASQHMRDALETHGIVPRKSLIAVPSSVSVGPLSRHYWRGVFDGDGCVACVRRRGRVEYAARMYGSHAMVTAYRAWALDVCADGFTAGVCKCKSIFVSVITARAAMRRVLEELYGGAKIALPRKRALAEKAVGHEL